MIIITLSELIILGFFVFFILSIILLIILAHIEEIYKRKSKKWKNCSNCDHYYLKDVAGCGDRCWYGCELKVDITDETTISGNNIKYRKCNDYKEQ